jgi:hypothetical protein
MDAQANGSRISRLRDGDLLFANKHLQSLSASDLASDSRSAAIDPGARAIPSPKNVARQCQLWSIRLPRSYDMLGLGF